MSKIDNKFYADWCNSNIMGSCPVHIGATPMSALYFIFKGCSLIGRASCSW